MRSSSDECELPPGVPGVGCGSPSQRCWIFPAALLLMLAGMVAVWTIRPGDTDDGAVSKDLGRAADGASTAGTIPSPAPEGDTISLSIDFGNGVTRAVAALSWRQGMTVADSLAAAAQFRPALSFSQRGDGPMTFLSSIDGVAAEGQGGRNWIVYVRGERCQTGIGVHQLFPGDAVLWKYEPYE